MVDVNHTARTRQPIDGHASTTRLLIRATTLDARVLAFADEVGNASGHPVTFVVDERSGPVDDCGRSTVGLTNEACESLALYCPPDYAWRCGDYCYYLARQRFPDAGHLWMIEYDVRFTGDRLAEFFAFFDGQPSIDFLATGFEAADWDWYWALASKGRDVKPYRCLFPVTRLSAGAIDALQAKRVAQSRQLFRRGVWPNDEALVATTLANGGFDCRDFNSFGKRYYDLATFSFVNPIDGDHFDRQSGDTKMFHPVLYGRQYLDKLAKLKSFEQPEPTLRHYSRRISAKFNSWSTW